MQEYEVKRIADDVMAKRLDEKNCPACKGETTMVKVYFYNEESLTFWRCLKCLTLFEEKMVPSIPPEKEV